MPCALHFGISQRLASAKGSKHACALHYEGMLLQEDIKGQVAERNEALVQMRHKLDELDSMRASDKVLQACKWLAVQSRWSCSIS